MPESLEDAHWYESKVRDEGGILLLLLIANSSKYRQEKNNLRNLVEPQGGIDPADIAEQRKAFIDFYHPGWTVSDLSSLLSYLKEQEGKATEIRDRYKGYPSMAADALMDLLSEG